MIDLFAKRIGALIRKQSKKVQAKLKKLTNLRKLSTKLFRAVMSKVRGMLSLKPQSYDDYIKSGETFIAKKLLVLLVLVVLVVLFVLNWFLIPWAEGRLWIPEIVINTDKFHGYTGKARVLTEEGNLLYAGELQNGRITGEGNLYDLDGNLVYRGEFQQEEYHGSGQRYDRQRELIYEGEFADNHYHGEGKLHEDGALVYEGAFQNGIFHGEGRLYEQEALVYEGEFQEGKYHGEGRLYNPGQLIYEGQFQNNLYHGEGDKYHDNGYLKYTGTFRLGRMDGEGKLYNRHGRLIYQGSFVEGVYDGEGEKFNENTGRIIYEGQFSQGEYHGIGSLYDDDLGRLKYDGHFKEGLYSGQGTLYNWKGQNIYDGYFYQGDIDYYRYIDQPVNMVREEFGDEDEVIFFDFHFLMAYEPFQVLFAFEFPEEDQPIVDKVIFLGDQNISGAHIGKPMDELPEHLGDVYSDFYYLVDEEKREILARLGQDRDRESLYSERYLLHDEAFLRFYALEPRGDVLYYEMGGL